MQYEILYESSQIIIVSSETVFGFSCENVYIYRIERKINLFLKSNIEHVHIFQTKR